MVVKTKTMSPKLTPVQIKKIGFEVLKERLGVVGFIRFLQQFELGKGNYTQEREKLLENKSVDEIIKDIKQINT